jgi:hypothetical protein
LFHGSATLTLKLFLLTSVLAYLCTRFSGSAACLVLAPVVLTVSSNPLAYPSFCCKESERSPPCPGFSFSSQEYPAPDSDASVSHVWGGGGFLQQKVGRGRQPLAFLLKKALHSREVKYSTCDRELLGRFCHNPPYFRFLLEGRQFQLLTDHKPRWLPP